jgi:basic membrane lipoprotein Med (substrate-binding protein (PBP1-ABC) superfamily)
MRIPLPKRSLLILFLLATTSVCLPACGGGGGEKSEFRVALLLTGPISDDGWNASAYEGLRLVERELEAQVAKVESLDKSQFEENLREFAAQGYDLIFGHAYEFQDAALRIGAEFPKTTFVVIAGNSHSKNVGSVHFKLEEATYPLGALAARLSESAVAGMIGGEEIPSLIPGFNGFVNGAKSVNPDFQVITKYVGNWHDVALAREHAEALIEQGAEFIFQNADKAGLGVFQAASEHDGVWAFGSNRDQSRVLPGAVLASAVLDVPAAYLKIAREVHSGAYSPRAATMGVEEGVVSVVVSPESATELGPEIALFLAELEQKIALGEIAVLETLSLN